MTKTQAQRTTKLNRTLTVLTLQESVQWDAIVRSFKDFDVYYLSGYVRGFMIHGDGEPCLFFFEDQNVRGIHVVMRRDISNDEIFNGKIEKNKWFDFITPYGYGGWLIEGNGDSSELFRKYEVWCRCHNIVSEFVRYHPLIGNHSDSSGFYDISMLGETVAIQLSNLNQIWMDLTSKNRNMIRKAQKSGVLIYHGRYPEIYDIFRSIYNSTMDKDEAKSYYYFSEQYYKSIIDDLPQEAQVFYAELNGKIIAASIILASNRRLNYHLSGSVYEYRNFAPTNLLLYYVALWGFSNGYKTFHLGGGIGSSLDDLYKFKKSFNRGDSYKFHVGKRLYLEDIYQELSEIRENKERYNSNFFPAYRS